MGGTQAPPQTLCPLNIQVSSTQDTNSYASQSSKGTAEPVEQSSFLSLSAFFPVYFHFVHK